MAQRFIRIADLTTTRDDKGNVRQGRLPISPATWWRWVKEKKAPAPFKLGPNVTVWDLDQIEAFLAQHAEGAVLKAAAMALLLRIWCAAPSTWFRRAAK